MMETFQSWDGKTVSNLRDIAAQLRPADHPMLIDACHSTDETTARAASWVLKAEYEKGGDIAYPVDLLTPDLHWEVALHLLQSIQYTSADIPSVMVAPFLSHQKPTVRAWALDAYVRLGAADAATVLATAEQDPAASVRARARNLTK